MNPIALTGSLDQYAAEPLKEQALAVLEVNGNVIFDFADVDRMHTASLQVLIALRKELEAKGRRVVLQSVSNQIRELFRISGTEDLFEFSERVL